MLAHHLVHQNAYRGCWSDFQAPHLPPAMALETPGHSSGQHPCERSKFHPIWQIKRVQNTTTRALRLLFEHQTCFLCLCVCSEHWKAYSFPPNLFMMFWQPGQVHPNSAHAKNKSLECYKGHFTSVVEGRGGVHSGDAALAEGDPAPGAARGREGRVGTRASS